MFGWSVYFYIILFYIITYINFKDSSGNIIKAIIKAMDCLKDK